MTINRTRLCLACPDEHIISPWLPCRGSSEVSCAGDALSERRT